MWAIRDLYCYVWLALQDMDAGLGMKSRSLRVREGCNSLEFPLPRSYLDRCTQEKDTEGTRE
jgi:hypothetical protein